MKRLSVALALHNHQPVGNFGWVLEQLHRDAYLPMVECLERHPRVKVALHYTGFLLDWLREWHPDLIDRVSELVARGQVEVMGGGYYEPILPCIPDRDKARQLTRLADAVENAFGTRPEGLWLAERVWEASLAKPLAEAGYRYTILDDSHFERVGLQPEALYTPFLTEEQGHRMTLLVTGTAMRYLIPWRTVEECLEYFRRTASDEPRLVLMGDDGEKLGGWPTTSKLCWEERWVDRFFEALEENSDWLEVVLPGEYAEKHRARGPVYLPAGSYPEMLKWSGGYWRNFIARYPEINAMHKKMLRVSARVEAAGAPAAAVNSLLRGQANDAYWHGVFGGVYLPHLRRAVWENLVAAERAVADADLTTVEWSDYDLDGACEILVDTPAQSVYIAPSAGASVVEWDAGGRNAVDCMTRREEPYHQRLREGTIGTGVSPLEEPLRVRETGLEKRLHYDSRRRLAFQAYLLEPGASLDRAVRGRLTEVGGFATGEFTPTGELRMERTEAILRGRLETDLRMIKRYLVSSTRPMVELQLSLQAKQRPIDAILTVEWNLGLPGGPADGEVAGRPLDHPAALGEARQVILLQPRAAAGYRVTLPRDAQGWYYPVETINNSDSGYERIVQGACLMALTPVRVGSTPLRLRYRIESVLPAALG